MHDTPLRGAVVGFGFISSQGHLPAYLRRSDVKITAVADICDERRSLAMGTLPEAKIYTDFGALLECESQNLDFIDIATPPCDHARIAHAALERGLHVLCEKPLTTEVAEAKSLMSHAQSVKRVLYPVHNYKHAPVVRSIRQIIESGQIGKVHSVTLNTFRNTHAKGVPEWRPHWRRERSYSGGGIAMDHGSHTLYLAFDWLGAYPTAVTAKMNNLHADKYDTEDNFSAVLTFPGGLAHVHLTWTAGVRKIIYTIQGEKGAITVDDDEIKIAVMRKTAGPDVAQGAVAWEVERKSIPSHWMDASHVQWFGSLFDEFKDAIFRQDWSNKALQDAYQCIQVIATSYSSSAAMSQELPLPSAQVAI
ncbi:MAG: Gfo/Idh/MocA family oxidoreductase [Deltaproteobacteria bacterium]|nr:Gfo/Idh/MocA family oxidoreductase [Deltaproteobacteria bacterium]